MSWAEEHGLRPAAVQPLLPDEEATARTSGSAISPTTSTQRLGQVLDRDRDHRRRRTSTSSPPSGCCCSPAPASARSSRCNGRWVDLERQLAGAARQQDRPEDHPPERRSRRRSSRRCRAATATRTSSVGRRDGAHPGQSAKSPGGASAPRPASTMSGCTTCATRSPVVAAAQKGSLPMIGRLLGHSNTRTTARYAHLADDPVDGLNATVGEAIASAIKSGANRSERTKTTWRLARCASEGKPRLIRIEQSLLAPDDQLSQRIRILGSAIERDVLPNGEMTECEPALARISTAVSTISTRLGPSKWRRTSPGRPSPRWRTSDASATNIVFCNAQSILSFIQLRSSRATLNAAPRDRHRRL